MGVELSPTQFQICQQPNGQFCHISTPFQLLANPPTCIAALYTKSKAGIASKCSLQSCKTTTTTLPTQIIPDVWILHYTSYSSTQHSNFDMSRETHGNNPNLATNTHTEATHSLQCHFIAFYLPPRYETPMLEVNVSLNMANLQMISAQCFCIWQHLGNNKSDMQLQYLATIPSIPVHKVYQHLLNSTMQIVPFNTHPSEDTDSLWSVFTHPGIYISVLGLIIPVEI